MRQVQTGTRFPSRSFAVAVALFSWPVGLTPGVSMAADLELTMIQSTATHLNIQVKDVDQDPVGSAQMAGWEVVTPRIRFRALDPRSVSTTELVRPDKVQSIVTGGEICVVYERPLESEPPTIEWHSTLAEDVLVLTTSEGQCGGCVTAWARIYDEEHDKCDFAPPEVTCTICVESPCPDPEPEPDPWDCDPIEDPVCPLGPWYPEELEWTVDTERGWLEFVSF